MDGNRFDALSKKLAEQFTRRSTVKGAAVAALAAVGLRRSSADAQVTVAACGNKICKNNPGKCTNGCFCCVYSNGNSRCLPPGQCNAGGGAFVCADGLQYDTVSQSCVLRCTDKAECDAAYPNTVNLQCIDGFCSQVCFTAGTRVAMADGTSRAIETIQAGDLVLGEDGQINRVLHLQSPRLGGKKLYGLNGGTPFVTADHPFATEAGWKAVDPPASMILHPNLAVGRLAIGDRLLSLAAVQVPAMAGGGVADRAEIRLEPVALTSLIGVPESPETTVYNLMLDGNHTYFANELLVHNRG